MVVFVQLTQELICALSAMVWMHLFCETSHLLQLITEYIQCLTKKNIRQSMAAVVAKRIDLIISNIYRLKGSRSVLCHPFPHDWGKGTEVLMILLNLAYWELLSCDGWFYVIISQLMIWTHLIRQTLNLAHTNQDSPTQDLYRLSLFITTVERLMQAAQYVIITRVLRLTKWQICNCRKKILLGFMMATTSVILYPQFCKFYTRGKAHSFEIIWFLRLHKHGDDIAFDLSRSTARKLWGTNDMKY